jgi:DNA/RNA endonuclease YhcR with UshA esterase domain
MMKRILMAATTAILTSLSAMANVILTETFTYADGPVVSGSAGIWTTHSGTTPDQVDVASGKINLTETESEDVNATLIGEPYTAAGSAVLYARFTVNFSALPTGTGGHFAHFRDKGNGFRARLFATTTGAAAGTLRLAIGYAGNSGTPLETDLSLGTTYTVMFKLDLAAGNASLWVNPAAETDPSAVSTDSNTAISVSTFAFRQSLSNGNGMGTLVVDDLKVATTFAEALDNSVPEPTPPVILTQPTDRTSIVGSTATFTVGASGSAPLTFIWEKDKQDGLGTWEPVNGATTATLTLPNVQLTDSGATYRVRVTNSLDSVLSVPVTLTVIEDPATTISTIAQVRAKVDPATLIPTDTTTLYRVEGIVITHINVTSAAHSFFYIQDATGGIGIFVSGGAGVVPPAGAKVRVTGPMAHFNGLLELGLVASNADHKVETLSTGNPLPAATPLNYTWPTLLSTPDDPTVLDAEANEAKLVVAANVLIDTTSGPTFTSGSNVTITDAADPGKTFTLRVDSRVLDIIGQQKPTGPCTITGVLSQFDLSAPHAGGYQLLPTRYADIESTTKAPSIRFTNTLANLVRPGDLPVNTFRDHALRPGESITIAFEISDPEGKPVTVTLGNTIPAGAQWNFASLTGTTVTGTFTYTATAAAAGNAYPITVQAANDTTSFTQTINLYVPTVAEQAVVITEFYANPTETATAPNFNPLNRAELLPGGNDASPANRDEFVEIVNLSGETVDLTGWMLSDALLRRAFLYAGTPGTTLAPSNAVIVYGGPTLGYTPQLSVPAIAAEVGPGDAFSTAGIALNNDGDTIILRNAASNIVARVVYVGAQTSADSSLTRFPTSQDAFVAHRTAGDAYWSPGNQAGGLAWTEPQPNADVAPTFTTPPVDVSVVVGTPAIFTVVAAGVPAPTYQWQRGESNIETATAASYTLASPQFTDSGATFRVIVSNRAGSITSAPVTLTVTEPPPEILKTNIAYLRTQVDPVNLRPANTTQLYEVEGTVTTHVNLTGSANTFFYLQDDTAAISVFVTGKPGSEVPPAGARVRVVGPLGHFNGLLELNLAASNAKHVVEVLSTGNALPATTALDYAWPTTMDGLTAASPGVAAAEASEAKLVRVNNVLVDTISGANFTSGSNVTITDAADAGKTFVLRIDSRVAEIIGTPKPTGPVSLVGVLGQFDSADPRAGGYQLIVTRLADIITGGTPEPITATAAVTAESVTLSWNGTAGATYSVRRGLTPQGPFESIASGLTAPTFTEATGGRGEAFYQITSP